jgi:hypothetical protein
MLLLPHGVDGLRLFPSVLYVAVENDWTIAGNTRAAPTIKRADSRAQHGEGSFLHWLRRLNAFVKPHCMRKASNCGRTNHFEEGSSESTSMSPWIDAPFSRQDLARPPPSLQV